MRDEKGIVSCRKLNFSYSGKSVLKDITLDFYPGEFIGLLGPNGAGKSTLLSCLCGLLPSDFDRLSINGLDLSGAGRKDIARQLSYVPQEHEDMFPFSVIDVVVMGRSVYLGSFGAPGKKDFEMAEKVLAELQILNLKYRIYTTLSGGEKQMTLLARALVQSRKIVFLDEPTNHLDYKNRYQMLSQLKSLSRDSGSCVVASLHDPNHALLFADRVILLGNGRILADGATRTVLSGEAVSRLYGIAAWQGETSAVPGVFPAFVHPSFRRRVLLLTGSSGQGKSTLLEQVVKENKALAFGGIVCPGTYKHGRRYSHEAFCLDTGASALFAKREGGIAGRGFRFYEAGRALADQALDPVRNRMKHCVVVDEVGPLELKGLGHAPMLAPLLALEKPRHIWSVRPDILDAVCRKWMLSEPVIVDVGQPDAMVKIKAFLNESKGGVHG